MDKLRVIDEGKTVNTGSPFTHTWARLDYDGTQWLNLEGRGWVRVSEILRELDQIPKICNTLSYVGGIAVASAAGVIGIITYWMVFG